ncbi:MAG: pirin family protein [Halopseudomonas sabulinigri]
MTNQTTLRKANQRGIANHGWLQSRHSFSFGSYYDPEHIGFSDLLVINDDRVAPAGGFGKHPHRDMEIFSYVLEGSLKHEDTLGNGSLIKPGDVQLMSAGTGVAHSEYNASNSTPVHFLQIWIMPGKQGIQPEYQQQHIAAEEKRGRLRLILAPDGAKGALTLHQDARVYAGLFNGAEHDTLTLPTNRHAYVHVASGTVTVNGQQLSEGDGLKLRHAHTLEINQGQNAEVLVFDLRPHEVPRA